VYQFFNQYSQALSNGGSLAGQTIDDIIAAVAPPVEAQVETDTIFKVLGATLGIVSTFNGLVPGAAGTATGLILGGLGNVLSASQDLQNSLLVTQTANERFTQIGKIGSGLANFIEGYQNNLLATVQKIQGDDALFRATCGEGGFSQRVTTSLTIQASALYRQLQLFVLSQALQANGIVSSKSTGVNVLDFAKETTEIQCASLTSAGNCFQWFLDSAAGNTYAFHNPGDTENTQVTLTNAIVDNGWAPLDQVFKMESCSGQAPTFDPKTLSVTCLVSKRVYPC